ncbi:MAG: hypothetical protein EOP83_02765 [Verrucomicrobiaceae bacterium]|nr:MAG: hypothetical protein EOP83_02765 [Verrucomicrobiaceae bacterium]
MGFIRTITQVTNPRDRDPRAVLQYPYAFYYHHLDVGRDAIMAWCVEQFGEPGSRYAEARFGSDMGPNLRYIFLRDQPDAFAFKMRWM